MENAYKTRLADHCVALFSSVVMPEVTDQGCIRVFAPNGDVYEDDVTTHHLVELCVALDRQTFGEIIQSACRWFSDKRGDPSNPFYVTTLAVAGAIPPVLEKRIVHEGVLAQQRRSGLLEIFSGFLDGGSIFSTLWATRILLVLNGHGEYTPTIASAMKAVADRWSDIHRTSFKGFYYYLLGQLPAQSDLRDPLSIVDEIVAEQGPTGLWDDSLLYTSYIVDNLLSDELAFSRAQPFVDKALVHMFDLEKEAARIPEPLAKLEGNAAESVYLQTCIRAIMAAVKYLRASDTGDPTNRIVAHLVGTWPDFYQAGRGLAGRLKQMESQYGAIHSSFAHIQDLAKPLLAKSPYEKNVFIMMPFRQKSDTNYEDIEIAIKETLAKHHFRGWVASDLQLGGQLWDSVQAYLVACKFAVAVFTHREVIRTRRNPGAGVSVTADIVEEFNPNVSLELGFELSRGKQVLFLKDALLRTVPTDLMGQYYEEFELKQARRDVPPIVEKWIQQHLLSQDRAETTEESSGE